MELIKRLSKDEALTETMYLVKNSYDAENLADALESSKSNDVIRFEWKNAS